jgi:hypothetical protein
MIAGDAFQRLQSVAVDDLLGPVQNFAGRLINRYILNGAQNFQTMRSNQRFTPTLLTTLEEGCGPAATDFPLEFGA